MIGLNQFHKKGVHTFTKANNSCNVLAALHLMVLLQLEDFLVCGYQTQICNSQMKFLKISTCSSVDGQLTNHHSFRQVNKKFAWFVIDFFLSN
jgi:hypothetical protein